MSERPPSDSGDSGLTCELSGLVTRGHRVASGLNGDARFPGGTIAMQIPVFQELGFDLSGFFPGTLNVSVAPMHYEVVRARHTFRQVKWHPVEPPEDFSFFDAEIRKAGAGDWVRAWIYRPHPDTKPAHHQSSDTLEVLAVRRIGDLNYGDRVEIRIDPAQMAVRA